MRRALQLVVMCLGCGGAASRPVARDAATEPVSEDRDADGLCDATELAMGTEPARADTDGDGLLDGHEVIAGTDPRDRDDPGVDHIVFLLRGASVDFEVALSVDVPGSGSGSGSGSDVSGAFDERNGFDPEDRRAGGFYRGSTAVDAQPPENVRNVDERQARFESVLGHTLLRFQLHFEDEADAGASDGSNAAHACAAVLPFDYGATADDGTELTQKRFVLIVADSSPPLSAAAFCLPAACL